MKNLINFKKFSLNESDQIMKAIDSIPDDSLDSIIDSVEGDSLLNIKENVPYLYQVLLKRAKSRGMDIDRVASVRSKMRYI
jgi:hypothetical protein